MAEPTPGRAPWPTGLTPSLAEVRAGFPQSSGVLVILFESNGLAHLHMTRRAAHLRSNPNEITFAGGRFDLRDGTHLNTALREAQEEVGLDPELVEVIGTLPTVLSVPRKIPMHPFVGMVPATVVLQPNQAEVSGIVTLSLVELLAEGAYRQEVGTDGEPSHVFTVAAGSIVKGTAAILASLLALLA